MLIAVRQQSECRNFSVVSDELSGPHIKPELEGIKVLRSTIDPFSHRKASGVMLKSQENE